MKIKIPFWLQITSILLAGVIVSISVFFIIDYVGERKKNEALGTHTVTFAYSDGTIIETKEVSHGKGIFPPTLKEKGVFRGWSAGFNIVVSDIEVHPIYHNIAESNLFYFDSVYVKEGEKFSIDVCVGGTVSVSSGELILEYDPDVLKFQKTNDKDDSVNVVHSKGKITIAFNYAEPLKAESVLSKLQFKAKKKDVYSTELLLKAVDMKVVSEGKETPVECATLNNKIFFLQEVEQ